MQVQQIGAAYAVADPTGAHEQVLVDFVRRDHEMWPEPSERISGALLALLVDPDPDWMAARGL